LAHYGVKYTRESRTGAPHNKELSVSDIHYIKTKAHGWYHILHYTEVTVIMPESTESDDAAYFAWLAYANQLYSEEYGDIYAAVSIENYMRDSREKGELQRTRAKCRRVSQSYINADHARNARYN